ncbi:AIM24 family protein, partial [Escherichia coli]|uniref:AIM24 family protein n=2 Tax=Bacteria TaxID=2 RepID=UPI002861FD0D
EGSGGLGKFMKKMVSGEGGALMRVAGQGEVFFARQGADVFTLTLEGEGITINTSNLLAFDANLQWDIKMLANAGMMTGG